MAGYRLSARIWLFCLYSCYNKFVLPHLTQHWLLNLLLLLVQNWLPYNRNHRLPLRSKYRNFESLTDLYLAILYPPALEGDFCYALYASPSTAYKQNSGLDENQDGIVSVKDIDSRMKRIYPTAYILNKEGNPNYENDFSLAGFK